MLPAQVVARTVAVGANAGAQALYFIDQCDAIHSVQIRIHYRDHFPSLSGAARALRCPRS
jgi:hypothetical protein